MTTSRPLTDSEGPFLEPIPDDVPITPAAPNPLNKFKVEINPDSLKSREAFKASLDGIKVNYDKFECTHRDHEIHSLKTVIANKIVEALNEKFPDNSWHGFEEHAQGTVAAHLVKSKLLEAALQHDLFKPRKWVAVHDAVNNTAHYATYFFTPASHTPAVNPVMPTGCQSVLKTALRTEKHKFMANMYRRQDDRSERKSDSSRMGL